MMRRNTVFTAGVLGILAASSAHSALILIDNFDSPDMVVIDQAGGGATVANSPGLLPNGRVVSHELLAGINDLAGSGAKVTIGGATFPVGSLEVANAGGRDSEVKLSWSIAAGLVPTTAVSPALMAVTVVASDGNPTSLELLVNGISQGNFFIPGNTFNDTNYFALSAAAQNALAGGGTMMLVVNGETGWDVTVDSFGIEVPEPSSVALVGLALLAGGIASRRSQKT